MKPIATMVERICLGPLRLLSIQGFEQRRNDVIYCHPLNNSGSLDIVVFFGGDVQDFTENMKSHRDNKNYCNWNLDNTALQLRQSFSHSHIIVIRPNRMEYKTFSCYDNFVPCNQSGVPSHTSTNNGLTHLKKLISTISNKLKTMTSEDFKCALDLSRKAIIYEDSFHYSERDISTDQNFDCVLKHFMESELNLEELNIKVIGFSKGCIVLNQFLYEFHYYKTFTSSDSNEMKFISKIKDMYWLDGGHSGGKNTWITSRQLLETLASSGITIHIHVTPYQIADERRPWIKKEEKTFADVLIKLGAHVDRKVHFPNLSPSLTSHFNVLKEFTK